MFKLLDAGFSRMKKSKVSILLLIYTIGIALFMLYTQYSDMKEYGETIIIHQLFVNSITIIGAVIAVFICLFIGTEYSDGTLRNKIIVGASRIKIYLSNLIIVSITTLLSEILYLIIIAIIGIPIFGGLNMSLGNFALIFVDIIGIIFVFSAIFTFISMLVSNKTISVIVSIALFFAFMIISVTLFSRIEAPEYREVAKIVDAETQEIEVVTEKNPRYLTEEKRNLYETILNFIPQGQAFLVAGRADTDFEKLPLYALSAIIIITVIGMYLFNKKELI